MDKRNQRRRVCLARNCNMSTQSPKYIDNSVQFFSFPTDPERCNAWLKLIGRSEYLGNPVYKRHSNAVCSLHFDESDLTRHVSLRLKPDAFPFVNVSPNMPITQSTAPYSGAAPEAEVTTTTELQCATDFLETLAMTHTLAYDQLPDKLFITENQIDRFAASNLSNDDELSSLDKFRLFIKRSTIKKRPLREQVELRDVVLNLLFSNPETYRFLKPSSVLHLPNIKSLSNACIATPVGAKIDDRLFELLRIKMQYMPAAARYCTLCITEYKVTPGVYYDITHDTVTGLEDVNGYKSLQHAEFAVIATLRGIRVPWLQPISFCFVYQIENIDFDSWLSEILLKLQTTDIIVQAITVPPTEGFYNFALKKQISCLNTFFKENIHFLFDAPQLIRRVKDIFVRKPIYVGTEVVKFEYVRIAYNFGKKADVSLTPNLSSVHFNPLINEVSTRVAAQTLSRSVAAALYCYVDLQLLSVEARATAKFIQSINDAFDLVNKPEARSKKVALSVVEETMNTCIATLNILSSEDDEDNFNENMKITGEMFALTVASVSNIRCFQYPKDGYGGVNPRELNLEPLNAMLGRLKTYNDDSTCQQFLRSFRSLCQFYMFVAKRPHLSKREDFKQFVERMDSLPALLPDVLREKSKLLLEEKVDYRFQLPVKDELVYLAAYLLYKCCIKHNTCVTKCRKMIKMFDRLQLVSNVKHFEHLNSELPIISQLRVPEKSFNSYIRQLNSQFIEKFPSCLNDRAGIGSALARELDKVSWIKYCDCFPKNYLLTLFVRVRLYLSMKRNNKLLKKNEPFNPSNI